MEFTISQDEIRARFLAMLADCNGFDYERAYIQCWVELFNQLGELKVHVNEHHKEGTIYSLEEYRKATEEWQSDSVVAWQVDFNNSPGQEFEAAKNYIQRVWGSITNWRARNHFKPFADARTSGDGFGGEYSQPDNEELIWFLRYLSSGTIDENMTQAIEICKQLGIKGYSSDPVAECYTYENFKVRKFKNRKWSVTGLTTEQTKRWREFVRFCAIKPTSR